MLKATRQINRFTHMSLERQNTIVLFANKWWFLKNCGDVLLLTTNCKIITTSYVRRRIVHKTSAHCSLETYEKWITSVDSFEAFDSQCTRHQDHRVRRSTGVDFMRWRQQTYRCLRQIRRMSKQIAEACILLLQLALEECPPHAIFYIGMDIAMERRSQPRT